ncbi:MAG: ABC transporter substrate-binding protein, partial [Colwellia sp.]|nr:ABC transporter substrate-binding protein [Colwellia sp.]
RSKRNLEAFLADQQALIVFSGLHSLPLLANKKFINNNKILMLDPWAAAGPITRSNGQENWIFRLSIDDSNAGTFITKQALKEGFKKPLLLLEDTGWGRSNERTMTQALQQSNIKPSDVKWFNWGLGINHAKLLLREAKLAGSDVIFFVGNANEGKVFFKAMAELEDNIRLPIRSHWGITGGNFAETINAEQRKELDLLFIQTQFSFLTQPQTALAKKVFKQTSSRYPMIKKASDIKAQTGFIHAYDLTKILISAIKQAGLSGNTNLDKQAIKVALENLKKPVSGLIKNYKKPFSQYSKSNVNAHEALSINDYVMAYYDDSNNIVLIK